MDTSTFASLLEQVLIPPQSRRPFTTLPANTFKSVAIEDYDPSLNLGEKTKGKERKMARDGGNRFVLDADLGAHTPVSADPTQNQSTSKHSPTSIGSSTTPLPNQSSSNDPPGEATPQAVASGAVASFADLRLDESVTTLSRNDALRKAMASITQTISDIRQLDAQDPIIGHLEQKKDSYKKEIQMEILRSFISRNEARATNIDARDIMEGAPDGIGNLAEA